MMAGASIKFNRGNLKSAKLTPTQVLEIRERYSLRGQSQGQLSREYQVTVGTIGRIVRGETWQQFQQIESEEEIDARIALDQVRYGPRPSPTPEEILASQKKLLDMLGDAAPPDLMKAVREEAAKDEAEAKEERESEVQARETIDKQLDEFTQEGDSSGTS